jgi:hypothetical protein
LAFLDQAAASFVELGQPNLRDGRATLAKVIQWNNLQAAPWGR